MRLRVTTSGPDMKGDRRLSKTRHAGRWIGQTAGILAAAFSVVIVGCQSPHAGGDSSKAVLAANAVPASIEGMTRTEAQQAGEIYTAKCARCHKFYDPAAYREKEWQMWMRKMSRKSHLDTNQEQLLARYLQCFSLADAGVRQNNP